MQHVKSLSCAERNADSLHIVHSVHVHVHLFVFQFDERLYKVGEQVCVCEHLSSHIIRRCAAKVSGSLCLLLNVIGVAVKLYCVFRFCLFVLGLYVT